MPPAETYSLRQVVDLTGLSEFTLRGWENRYGAFSPSRSPTGRRRYSGADLQRAMLLRELTRREHRIGELAGLSLPKLRELLEPAGPGRWELAAPASEIAPFLKALALQEWDGLDAKLRSAVRRRGIAAIRELVLPLLAEAGSLVQRGLLSISQEHILSSLTKELLFGLCERVPRPAGKPRFVMATPEGDHHELGILVAHAFALHYGMHSLYLGPNSPKNELCETALRYGASHLVVGTTISRREGAREELFAFVHYLDQHLPKGTNLWLGGRNAANFAAELARPSLHFASLLELEARLKEIAGR